MAAITTKYSVGDDVYIIDSRGIGMPYFSVEIDTIRSISLGEYGSPTYEFRIAKRNDRDIYTDLEAAKKAAKKQAKDHYERNLQLINEQQLKQPSVADDPIT